MPRPYEAGLARSLKAAATGPINVAARSADICVPTQSVGTRAYAHSIANCEGEACLAPTTA
jgi:hypothetical protein